MLHPRPVGLTTRPLYGIIATQKSNVLGQRRLVKAHHSTFITHRALGSRLPVELIDQIADHVTELFYVDVLDYWRTSRGREETFAIPTVGGTVAEKAAAAELEMASGGALCTRLVVEGAERAYVHISASENRPDLVQVVPGAVPATGPTLRYADGSVEVQCSPGTDADLSKERVKVWPNVVRSRWQTGRLVQIDGIEEAIKRWDQQAVECYVELLGLKVVTINGEAGGGLTPRLRLLQFVEWM